MSEFPQTRTLVLSEREFDAARQLLAQLVESPAPEPGASASNSQLMRFAKGIVHRRKRRSAFFPAAMFGEPAWDILLTLYTEEQLDPTVTSLAAVTGAPQSSTTRWIDYLEGQRFILRESHPTDRRSAIARLTENGRAALEGYLSEVLTNGL
jgi:DNA-binding MarR family transcriptional regulator